MTKSEFSRRLESIFDELRALTGTKGVEYANDGEDQLANFKRLEGIVDVDRKKVAVIFLTKHMDAIHHAVRTGKVLSESIHGRCTDAVLYLILLDALFAEEAQTRQNIADALGLDPLPCPTDHLTTTFIPSLVNR